MFDISLAVLISRAIVLLVAVVIHEFAHGYVALLMGDTTAQEQGRLTLDPRANVYWPGFFIGVLIGFAILGSAPISAHRMRNPRWGMVAAVMAGPVSNLLVAVVAAYPFRLGFVSPVAATGNPFLPSAAYVLQSMVFLNVLLFFFNLLPIPPLDGFHIALRVLPDRWAIPLARLQPYGMIILILLIFVGGSRFNILRFLVSIPSETVTRFLLGA